MLKIYENRFKFLLLPAVIIVLGIIFYFVNGGFNVDVEFSGGTRLHVNMEQSFNNEEVGNLIKEKAGVTAVVQKTGNGSEAIIKFKDDDKQTASTKVFSALKEQYKLKDSDLLETGILTASYGAGMQKAAMMCVLWAVILMLLYITIRFEWRSAIIAILTLLSNVLCMIAFYAIFRLPINTSFVAAVLTILGYSINDVIVVFDRIRESRSNKLNRKKDVTEVAELSIHQTITRSVNTSVTTLITIVVLYIMGVPTIKEFALPIIIGILVGTYASIFIAAPMWAWWKDASDKQKRQAARAK